MRSLGEGLRLASAADAAEIARLVNEAYEVERFFVEGERTSAVTVGDLLRTSAFVVAVDPLEEAVDPGDETGLRGAVHIAVDGARATFGMLAVHPSVRGKGLGRRLIAAAESHARTQGAAVMEIHVVNLRTDLFPFYRRLGYEATGTAPYEHRPIIQPCHFVLMEKPLG